MSRAKHRIGLAAAALGLSLGGLSLSGASVVSAAPAPVTPTGHEQIVSPASPFTPATDANGNPLDSSITVRGTGFVPGAAVYAEICDGEYHLTAGWSPAADCDGSTATSAVAVGADGTVTFSPTVAGQLIRAYRGVGPSDEFNCIAPIDDPNGTRAQVPNAADQTKVATIDPNEPSWGGDSVGTNGGGYDPCQLRVTYNLSQPAAGDQFVQINLNQNGTPATPPAATPEAPMAVGLPLVGAALLAGGVVIRRRRHAQA